MVDRRVLCAAAAATMLGALVADAARAQPAGDVVAAAQRLTLDRVEPGRARESVAAWLQRALGAAPAQVQWRSGRCRQQADSDETSYDYPVCASAELHWQPGVILRIDVGFDARQPRPADAPLGVRGVLYTARARNWCDIYRSPSEIEARAPGAVRQIIAAGGSCL
jgi:hypothetical protein